MPVARTSISTSPRAGLGAGTCSRDRLSGSPHLRQTTALMPEACPPPASGEGDGRRDARHGAVGARGVALARGVLDEAGVPGTEEVRAAVAQPDLELSGEDD